jgi:hypothetical protein
MLKRELCGVEVFVRFSCSKCELRRLPTVSVAMQDVMVLQMSVWGALPSRSHTFVYDVDS